MVTKHEQVYKPALIVLLYHSPCYHLNKRMKPLSGLVYDCSSNHILTICTDRFVDFAGDFSKDDLAAGLLSTIAQDLAQVLHLNARVNNVTDVYCCGSFVGLSQTVRDEISTHFLARNREVCIVTITR